MYKLVYVVLEAKSSKIEKKTNQTHKKQTQIDSCITLIMDIGA